MSEAKEVIQIWKDKKITQGEFKFYCGGDSMGETELVYHTDKGVIVDSYLDGYFQDAVYANINFYDASDGHYMGEAGSVWIELDEGVNDEDDFTYSKSAQSEWSENVDTELLIQLTKEQADFIRKNVSDINGGADESENFNYSRDFILTDKDETTQSEIGKIVDETCGEFVPDTDNDLQEWYTFETIEVNDDDKLVVNISNPVYVYTDSDD